MSVANQDSTKLNSENSQDPEQIHRKYFDHPDPQSWKATRSLAQPSFLKQVESRGAAHTGPMKVQPPIPER